MGIGSDIAQDWHAALAALAWQLDCGADEALCDTPVDRYALPATPAAQPEPAARGGASERGTAPGGARGTPPQPQRPVPAAAPAVDPVRVAEALASEAADLQALRAAMESFDLCELKRGARNTVFGFGHPQARVLVLGGVPSRQDDVAGKPFTGPAGGLLQRMFDSIGLSHETPDPQAALFVASSLCWRPPGDLPPRTEDMEMLRPFLRRMIALVDPDVVVTLGGDALLALTGQGGLGPRRGKFEPFEGRSLLPMQAPDHLLRNPIDKRLAWADLLALRARLNAKGKGGAA